MIYLNANYHKRVYALVHDPIFTKPIQQTDYSKQGTVKLITKIRPLNQLK